MFCNLPPTPFDWHFRLFRFPVRVRVWFWLVMGLLGENVIRMGPQYLVLWVLCGFVSVLVHELGHAVFIRRFGDWCDIELIAFGGLAHPSGTPVERWKRIAISLAGPGFGLVFYGLLYGLVEVLDRTETDVPFAAQVAIGFLMMMNLFWSLFNLLPIWPLDGGMVSRELCQASSARNPDAVAFGISFFTSAGLAAIGVLNYFHSLPPAIAESVWFVPGPFMTMWMIMYAVDSYQLWEQARNAQRWGGGYDDDSPPWRR